LTETFLILLAGGIMLAAAISDPKQVELRWLRLCGVIAITLSALSLFFWFRRDTTPRSLPQLMALCSVIILLLAQLTLVQIARPVIARWISVLGFIATIASAVLMTSDTARLRPLACVFASVGIGATSGIALMDMLLGHAYLTAAKMTIAPFRRLNLALALALFFSTACSAVAILLQQQNPIEQFWNRYAIYLGTRWLVGLLLPAIFVYMAHDCIKRRSTQSATGILYVAGVLIFIGEIIALYLVRETGLPF
jgi:hypothetical protein